jgi:hypothetical protein
MTKPEIFFHVGLGKVASTYLQHSFFPKLQGIHYIKTSKYKHSPEIIAKGEYDRYFVSREFDQQLEDEVRWFSGFYPQARPIIIFRRHDSWIASQYRRYVKNGGYLPFKGFFDVTNDSGLWKRKHVTFFTNIEHLEYYFDEKPLVLFYDELRADPWLFFDKISNFSGTQYSREDISLAKVHGSYNTKQLKVMRKLARFIFGTKPPEFSTQPILHWLQRRGRLYLCYAILYPSLLLPARFFDDSPLIDPEELNEVREYFEEDWQRCQEYARRNNVG